MARDRSYRRDQHARAKGRLRRTWRVMDAQDGVDSGRHRDPVLVGRRANTRTFKTQEDRSYRGATRRRRDELSAAEQVAEVLG